MLCKGVLPFWQFPHSQALPVQIEARATIVSFGKAPKKSEALNSNAAGLDSVPTRLLSKEPVEEGENGTLADLFLPRGGHEKAREGIHWIGVAVRAIGTSHTTMPQPYLCDACKRSNR